MNLSADSLEGGAAAQSSEAEEFELPDGSTVSDLMEHLGMGPAFTPEMVLVNGDQGSLDMELHDGDAVALNGEMGGM
jgi:molybdopterin converting factor small subunit